MRYLSSLNNISPAQKQLHRAWVNRITATHLHADTSAHFSCAHMPGRSTAHYRRKSRQLKRLLQHSNTSTPTSEPEITYTPEDLKEEERCKELRRQAAQRGNQEAANRRYYQQNPLAAALNEAARPAAVAQRQPEAPQPQPQQPKPRTKIVRARYHVRNSITDCEKLIPGLPTPTVINKTTSHCLLDTVQIDFFVTGLTHAAIRPPALISL